MQAIGTNSFIKQFVKTVFKISMITLKTSFANCFEKLVFQTILMHLITPKTVLFTGLPDFIKLFYKTVFQNSFSKLVFTLIPPENKTVLSNCLIKQFCVRCTATLTGLPDFIKLFQNSVNSFKNALDKFRLNGIANNLKGQYWELSDEIFKRI